MAVVISFIIKTFLLRAFYIPSESMQPTLEVDDRIVVNLLAPGVMDIERGDVVVFEDTRSWWGSPAPETSSVQEALIFIGLSPDTSSHYVVKRVIGLEGDEVECCDEDGRILVNGEPIDEPYLFPGTEPSASSFDVTVPEGHVWLLGDNRSASADSRSHVEEPDQGAVPEDDIIGRTLSIVWPVDRWGGGGNERDPFETVPEPQ
ncbi:signal peptidase I [Nesterenkonia sp. Hz 6-5]|nr:signal peptidase I [Nesterenkonia haasae]